MKSGAVCVRRQAASGQQLPGGQTKRRSAVEIKHKKTWLVNFWVIQQLLFVIDFEVNELRGFRDTSTVCWIKPNL